MLFNKFEYISGEKKNQMRFLKLILSAVYYASNKVPLIITRPDIELKFNATVKSYIKFIIISNTPTVGCDYDPATLVLPNGGIGDRFFVINELAINLLQRFLYEKNSFAKSYSIICKKISSKNAMYAHQMSFNLFKMFGINVFNIPQIESQFYRDKLMGYDIDSFIESKGS